MKIISVNTNHIKGIRDDNGREILWEPEDDEDPDYFDNPLFVAIILYRYPEDLNFCRDDHLAQEWPQFYATNRTFYDDPEAVLAAFQGPYLALEVTTSGIACGSTSFTIYFILDAAYENQLESRWIANDIDF